jgi:hypothetical protein
MSQSGPLWDIPIGAPYGVVGTHMAVQAVCVPLPPPAAHIQRPPGLHLAMSLWERFRNRGHALTYVPNWDEDVFGRLSEGLFWGAHRAWRRHKLLGQIWVYWHYGLGSLSVILAAVAGFGGLSDVFGNSQAAVVAILSAVAGALTTFLNSSDKVSEHADLSSGWDGLRDDIVFQYEMRPEARESRQGPAGWQSVRNALQTRAKELRSGDAKSSWPQAAWPDIRTAHSAPSEVGDGRVDPTQGGVPEGHPKGGGAEAS